MPYHVQKLDDAKQWQTLYTEDDVVKADLLMEALVRRNPTAQKIQTGVVGYYFSNGYQVVWEADPDAGGETTESE